MANVVLCPELPWSKTALAFREELSNSGRVEFEDIAEGDRTDLITESRALSKSFPKLVLNVFQPDCLIANQIAALRHYANAMSVSMPIFNRDPNRWASQPHESGALPETNQDPYPS